MKSKILVVLMGVILLNCGLISAKMCNVEGGKKHGMGTGSEYGMEFGHNWEMMAKDLKLSNKQKEKIREQKYQSTRENIQNRSELKLKMYDLRYELKKDEIDDSKIDKLIDEISEIQKIILKNKINSMRSFREILTKDQWKKIRDMKMKQLGKYKKKKSEKSKRMH